MTLILDHSDARSVPQQACSLVSTLASGSEEDCFEGVHPKRRIKRQSTSDVSIGSVGDISIEPHSPTASGKTSTFSLAWSFIILRNPEWIRLGLGYKSQ